MTDEPDEVAPLVPIGIPGIPSIGYRVYPLADHIADKVCALVELHPRADRPAQASSRYRDLADLVVIAHTQSPDGVRLRRALTAEATRRGISLPHALSAPPAPGWAAGYARVARDVPGLAERTLDSAMVTAHRFLDPVLDGTLTGAWQPDRLHWG